MKKLTLITASIIAFSTAASASALESGAFYIKPVVSYDIGDLKASATGTTPGGSSGSITVTESGSLKNAKGFRGGVGFGYNVTEDIRTDVTFTAGNIKKKDNKLDNYSLLLAGYYNFMSGSSVSPYISLGVGLGRSRAKNTSGDATENFKTKNTTNAIYRAAVGLDFAMTKSIILDLNYGIGNIGSTKTKSKAVIGDLTGKATVKANLVQSIEDAVRFGF